MFIPGDVPDSPLPQKRTAEYKVQKLVMDVPENGKVYNAASLVVTLPRKEANEKRAIPVAKKEIPIVSKIQTDEREVSVEESSPDRLTYVYITEPNNTYFIYNIHTQQKKPIEEISTETTRQYFGQLSKYKSDITITLQGKYVYSQVFILVPFVLLIIICF